MRTINVPDMSKSWPTSYLSEVPILDNPEIVLGNYVKGEKSPFFEEYQNKDKEIMKQKEEKRKTLSKN